ncbi:MAG: phosphoribosyltransferase family protein [Candidatus Paceibacterota bacterium]|jgi:predicted amidophosphoribosyltransferase
MKKLLDLLFPKECINCKREGSFLCEDCLSLIEVNHFQYCLCEKLEKKNKCNNCKNRSLDKLFSATSFENKIVKNIINKLKNSRIKELSIPLAYLIIKHLQIIDCQIDNDFFLASVPISNKDKRIRGFNQSEEIARIISEATKIPLLNCIERKKENLFCVIENVKNKKIIVIDDVYITGSTMEEVSKKLKEAQASTVWGVTATRQIVDL